MTNLIATAIGLESELPPAVPSACVLSMQIQTCTNFAATRLHHDATFNVITISRVASLCTCNGIGQLRHIPLNTVSRLSRQIGEITPPLSKKRVGPTSSSSMPSSSPSLTSFFFLYQGTAHGSIGTQCRTILGATGFTVFENGYLIVIACDGPR